MTENLVRPKPGLGQILTASVVILVCLLLSGACLPGLIYLEACATVSAVLLMSPAVLVAIMQYRSTFHGHLACANWMVLIVGLIFAASLLVVFQVLGVMFSLVSTSEARPSLASIAVVVLLAIALATAVWSHWHWSDQLLAAVSIGSWSRSPTFQWTLKELLLVIAAVAFVFAISLPHAKPLAGIDVAANSTPLSLPEGAREVTYQTASYFTRYECTVDEAAFLAWVRQKGLSQELTEVKYTTVRAFTRSEDSPYLLKRKVIKRAWKFRWRSQDQGEYITYDRDTGRLYYNSHTR